MGRASYQDSYAYSPTPAVVCRRAREAPDAFAPYVPLDQFRSTSPRRLRGGGRSRPPRLGQPLPGWPGPPTAASPGVSPRRALLGHGSERLMTWRPIGREASSPQAGLRALSARSTAFCAHYDVSRPCPTTADTPVVTPQNRGRGHDTRMTCGTPPTPWRPANRLRLWVQLLGLPPRPLPVAGPQPYLPCGRASVALLLGTQRPSIFRGGFARRRPCRLFPAQPRTFGSAPVRRRSPPGGAGPRGGHAPASGFRLRRPWRLAISPRLGRPAGPGRRWSGALARRRDRYPVPPVLKRAGTLRRRANYCANGLASAGIGRRALAPGPLPVTSPRPPRAGNTSRPATRLFTIARR